MPVDQVDKSKLPRSSSFSSVLHYHFDLYNNVVVEFRHSNCLYRAFFVSGRRSQIDLKYINLYSTAYWLHKHNQKKNHRYNCLRFATHHISHSLHFLFFICFTLTKSSRMTKHVSIFAISMHMQLFIPFFFFFLYVIILYIVILFILHRNCVNERERML